MKKTMILLALLFLYSMPAYADSDRVLVFASAESATGVMNAYNQFLKTAYAKIGYDARFRIFPVTRTYVQADIDEVDGIVMAGKQVLEYFKRVIIVPVSLREIYLCVFTLDEDFTVEGPQSLKPYRIGIQRGYLVSEKLTRGMDRQIVDSYESLFSILQVRRVDVVLALKRETLRFLSLHPKFGGVRILEPPLYSLNLYHCLNKKHEGLTAEIAPIMEQMIKDRVLETLLKPYEKY